MSGAGAAPFLGFAPPPAPRAAPMALRPGLRWANLSGVPAEQWPAGAVPKMYGPGGPRIYGLESCPAFRAMTPPRSRQVAPAGLFNTGTNLLDSLLSKNCNPATVTSKWQVPWGKHNPVQWRGQHFAPSSPRSQNVSYVLPVMIVKDPLTWFKSMCRNAYAARFVHPPGCPSPLEATHGPVAWQPDRKYFYDSLAHLWSIWNRAYADLDPRVPRLVVRYEDLLFDAEATVGQICACAGSSLKPNGFAQTAGAAKGGTGHGATNDREHALQMYGSAEKRIAGYEESDVAFMRAHLDPALVDFFHYFLPGEDDGPDGLD